MSSEAWLGSIHTGYQRARAAWALATGTSPSSRGAVLALHALVMGAALVLFASCASAFHAGRPRRARRAVLWFATWPTHGVWIVSGLREPLLLLAGLAVLRLALAARAGRDQAAWRRALLLVGLAAALYQLATLRVYLAAAAAAGIAAACFLAHGGTPRRPPARSLAHRLFLATTIVSAAATITLLFAPAVVDTTARMTAAAWSLMPRDASDPSRVAAGELLLAPARLLLGPYAWVVVDRATPDLLLYPGQWIAYVALLPATAAALGVSLIRARRRPRHDRAPSDAARRRPLAPPLLPLAVAFALYAIPLVVVYAGHAARAWYPAIILTSLALPLGAPWLARRRWLVAAWLALLAVGIVLQVATRPT